MNIAILGEGAREHALAWAVRRSPLVDKLYVMPGNAGTAQIAQNVQVDITDNRAVVKAAKKLGIGLVVVGSENQLNQGVVDALNAAGILSFGPTGAATRIESSKVFARELMEFYQIPCAPGHWFSTFSQAKRYLFAQPVPVVIKADGLAAGKGVLVAQSHGEALGFLEKIMIKGTLSLAGDRVIIEECLRGREVSLFALTDGETVIPFGSACDYKRRNNGNHGPNTGGMGGYSPAEFLTPAMTDQIVKTILEPTVVAMEREGRPYKGVLYAGLMLTEDGPKVLEFNARFGDPETQVILPRLESDLVEIMLAVITGKLSQIKIRWSNDVCVGVVMAAPEYPKIPSEGAVIAGLDNLCPNILVFHGGTKIGENGEILTDGGRIVTIVAKGPTLLEAREEVYEDVAKIKCKGLSYRTDIAAIPTQGVMSLS